MAVKARIQGNAVTITLPKKLNVEAGQKFDVDMDEKGIIRLTPENKSQISMEELFSDWDVSNEYPGENLWGNDADSKMGQEIW